MKNKKKIITSAVAISAATTLLFGGTFAWQSISQTALNEKSATINPGGRLHDDFNGENKDVYVENFGREDLFVRIRLDEYFEIVVNEGESCESTTVITTDATKGNTGSYVTHKFDAENATDNWWEWTTGGKTVYMPTFNKDKDSLEADMNGTYKEDYKDYKTYTVGQESKDQVVYDKDINNNDMDNNIEDGEKIYETHKAVETPTASLLSMEEWNNKNEDEKIGYYWVYDSDGWVYYAKPVEPGEATGLLLDKISLTQTMNDSYYYAISVVCEMITADDLGQSDETGFFDTYSTTKPSQNALELLKTIGVTVTESTSGEASE